MKTWERPGLQGMHEAKNSGMGAWMTYVQLTQIVVQFLLVYTLLQN